MRIPAVAVCIPTFNGARWVGEALESALGQTFLDIEVIVCDDGSTDGTLKVARAYQRSDARVAVIAGAGHLGASRNANRAIQYSKAPLIKLLHQDDALRPECIEELRMEFANPAVGLAFVEREVDITAAADVAAATAWVTNYGDPHRVLDIQPGVTNGPSLFRSYMCEAFGENWLGEPSCVMLRRRTLERTGLFALHLRQYFDVDLWTRVAALADIAFVPKRLATWRLHQDNLTIANARERRHWLDGLWWLEGLYRTRAFGAHWELIAKLRHERQPREAAAVLSAVAQGRMGRRQLRELLAYTRVAIGGHTAYYGTLDQSTPPGVSCRPRGESR